MLDQPHDWLLGVNLYDRRRHTASTTLPVGASLVLYTDGAVERRDADLGEGFEHLRQAIQAAAPGRDADGICDAVVEAMLPTGRSRPDDVAILVVRRTGPEDAS